MFSRTLFAAPLIALLLAPAAHAQDKQSKKNQSTTLINITANFTSPDEVKKLASALSMAQASAQSGRKTIVFFNSSAAKIATTALPSTSKLPGDISLADQLSKLADSGVEMYVSANAAKQDDVKKKDLRKGVSLLSVKKLFKKVNGKTIVFSY